MSTRVMNQNDCARESWILFKFVWNDNFLAIWVFKTSVTVHGKTYLNAYLLDKQKR